MHIFLCSSSSLQYTPLQNIPLICHPPSTFWWIVIVNSKTSFSLFVLYSLPSVLFSSYILKIFSSVYQYSFACIMFFINSSDILLFTSLYVFTHNIVLYSSYIFRPFPSLDLYCIIFFTRFWQHILPFVSVLYNTLHTFSRYSPLYIYTVLHSSYIRNIFSFLHLYCIIFFIHSQHILLFACILYYILHTFSTHSPLCIYIVLYSHTFSRYSPLYNVHSSYILKIFSSLYLYCFAFNIFLL